MRVGTVLPARPCIQLRDADRCLQGENAVRAIALLPAGAALTSAAAGPKDLAEGGIVMRIQVVLVALLALAAPLAGADPNDLTGGVFILHHPPEVNWSCVEQYGFCPAYDVCQLGIQGCEGQNPRVEPGDTMLWYVVAAWAEEKSWRGVEFGIGDYPTDLSVVYFGSCFPDQGLDLPTPNWPAPNSGVSLAVQNTPWQGNFRPVYWFVAYDYATAGQFPLTVHPTTGFGGFANDATPTIEFPAACFGSLGLSEPGVACCPEPAAPDVCCLDGVCYWVLEEDCAAMGGVWHPEYDGCTPDPCDLPQPTGLCCIEQQCFQISEEECAANDGEWMPGLENCEDYGYVCTGGVPAAPATWGAIKALYR
jgi:hypothetical protein